MTVPPPQDRPEQWSQDHPEQQWPAGPAPQQWSQGAAGPSWNAGGQQTSQAPQQPAPTRTSRTRHTLLGALVGMLVAAVVVGGLALAGIVRFGSDSSTTAADTRAVDLPESLSALTDVVSVTKARNNAAGAGVGDRYARSYARTAELYRTAFDGAGAGVRTYTNTGLEFFLTVVAVRAESSGLVTNPQADPADLGVVAQPNIFDLVVDGDVQCLQTVTQVVTKGKQVQDDDLLTTVCRTTAAGLTVYVFGGGGNPGTPGKERMVDLARAVRGAVVGS